MPGDETIADGLSRRSDRPTLSDVAAVAGVHPSLVSRVLRDDPRGYASEQTRIRIRDAAAQLGYRANANARGLRSSRLMTLGLLLPGFTSPLYGAVANGAEKRASSCGYGLVFGTHAAGEPHETITDMLMHGRVDAMLVASGRIEDRALRQLAQRAPRRVVLVNRQVRGVGASVVLRDNDAARLAVRHLADLGHRHIGGVFGPPDLDTMVRRMKGFKAAVAEAGVTASIVTVASRDYVAGSQGAQKLLKRADRPTALLTATFPMAIGALAAAREVGIAVPSQLSVITVHNDQLADYSSPPLTTITLPAERLGAEAVELAISMVEGGQPRRVIVPDEPRLIVRGSTGPWPRT